MDKIEVQWIKNNRSHISQIYQSGIEYCFVSDDMSQCHPFVYCKDFLHDVVWANIHKKPAKIHGFSYDPSSKPAICEQRTRIAITNAQDEDLGKKVENTLDFVNQFAGKLHLKETQVFEVVNLPKKYDKCGIFLFDGSGMWMNSPPLLSMYTLLLRIGFAHTKGIDCMETVEGVIGSKIKPYQVNDRAYLSSAKQGILNIIKLGYRKFFYKESIKNYPKEVDIYTMHDTCGIVGFSHKSTSHVVKYWHRKSLESLLKGDKK